MYYVWETTSKQNFSYFRQPITMRSDNLVAHVKNTTNKIDFIYTTCT